MTIMDTQRTRVYKAEGVLAEHEKSAYATPAKVKRRIETILRSPWVRSHFIVHPHPVQLRMPSGSARASYHGAATFTLPRWAWRDWIILHEVAHMLESRRVEDFRRVRPTYSWTVRVHDAPQPPHGPRFCQTLVQLVERFMGRAAASDLRRSFALHRVRCSASTPNTVA